MALLSCPSGPQPDWCPRTTDDALPAILGLLPPGPAWDASHIEGTVQHTVWRAFASVIAFTYGRLCDFVDEFFCRTVNESRDQWIEEYGLNDPCDPYGHNLCIKVAATGGSTCDYFVEMASLSGWSITCEEVDIAEPIAGCFEVGCTPLGPTPIFIGSGSQIGYGQLGVCDYAEVVHHPDPANWETNKTSGASCIVPGSNLGHGPDASESCCFIVGYYDFEQPARPIVGDYCHDQGRTILFDCPRDGVASDTSPCAAPSLELQGTDATGSYAEYGHAYVWRVNVDIAAPQATAPAGDADETFSAAGNFMVGLPLFTTDGSSRGGTSLCSDNPVGGAQNFALCFLERIKPAHTTLLVKVNQP